MAYSSTSVANVIFQTSILKIQYAAHQNKFLQKRGLKRKYTDLNVVGAKIAKTEQSIEKFEKHLAIRTCPISLQYSAKPNITPDIIFDKEVKEIKQQAQQGLVDALTSFHKRRLESQRKRANYELSARKNKHVNKQPLKGKHMANIVKSKYKITELRNDISYLKELIYTLANKRDGNKTVCSLTL